MSCVLPGTHPLSFCAQGTIDDHSGTGHPELGRSYTQHFLFRLEATGAVTFPGQPGASHTESRRYADPAPGCELILSKFSVALPGLTGMCPSTVLIRRGRLGSAAGRKSPQIPVMENTTGSFLGPSPSRFSPVLPSVLPRPPPWGSSLGSLTY
jgi:hypothetical protein